MPVGPGAAGCDRHIQPADRFGITDVDTNVFDRYAIAVGDQGGGGF